MISAIITLLSALSLAAVAGWFSIVGFMSIYAGAQVYALIMGITTEVAKLVTVSWLYRNWSHTTWKLKAPLIYFTAALMLITSIGVFGFLSKAHLDQNSGTLDNSAKVERLNYQIEREKSVIADNEKVIAQLDATVASFLGKERIDKSLSVRKSQAPQRKQLRVDINESQKRIDELSNEKFLLESEVRKIQLDVGPVRNIAELIYGTSGNSGSNTEAAVRLFTLLIVSALDPLAVILLIAANQTLLRLRNETEKKTEETSHRQPQEVSNIKESDTEKTLSNRSSDIIVPDGCEMGQASTCTTDQIHISSLPVIMEEASIDEKIQDYASKTDPSYTFDASIFAERMREQERINNISVQTESFNKIDTKTVVQEEISEEIMYEETKESTASTKPPSESYQEEWTLATDLNQKIETADTITNKDAALVEIYDKEAPEVSEIKGAYLEFLKNSDILTINSPEPTMISGNINKEKLPDETLIRSTSNAIVNELLGSNVHFKPQKVNNENEITPTISVETSKGTAKVDSVPEQIIRKEDGLPTQTEITYPDTTFHKDTPKDNSKHKYSEPLSWLKEFKGSING